MEHPPLQRHEALVPLSRDHYVGLVHAQRLLKAADADDVARREAVAEFLDAWNLEIEQHFQDEERLLGSLMEPALRERFEREHAQLRAKAAEAQDRRRQVDPGADWTREVGQQLNDHIRWEERELFPALEASAGEQQLQAIRSQTQQIESERPRAKSGRRSP